MLVTGKIVRYGKKNDCFCMDDLKTWLKVKDTANYKAEQLFNFAKSVKGKDVEIEFTEAKEGKYTNKYAVKINVKNSGTPQSVKQEVQTSVPSGLQEVKIETKPAEVKQEAQVEAKPILSNMSAPVKGNLPVFNPDQTKGETPAQGMDRLNRRTAMATIVSGVFQSMVGNITPENYKTVLIDVIKSVEENVK